MMKNPGIFATGCAAINCHIMKGKHSCEFYPFPKDEDRCKLWVVKCRRLDLFAVPPSILAKYYSLCEKHFDNTTESNKKSEPVPTLFDFPCIQYNIPISKEPWVSDKETFPGGVDFKSLNRVVVMQDGKLFICGGPLLSPNNLSFSNILYYSKTGLINYDIPNYCLAFVSVIKIAKMVSGNLDSIELFNVYHAYVYSDWLNSKTIQQFLSNGQIKLDICEKAQIVPSNPLIEISFEYTNCDYLLTMQNESKQLNDSLSNFLDKHEEKVKEYFTFIPVKHPPLKAAFIPELQESKIGSNKNSENEQPENLDLKSRDSVVQPESYVSRSRRRKRGRRNVSRLRKVSDTNAKDPSPVCRTSRKSPKKTQSFLIDKEATSQTVTKQYRTRFASRNCLIRKTEEIDYSRYNSSCESRAPVETISKIKDTGALTNRSGKHKNVETDEFPVINIQAHNRNTHAETQFTISKDLFSESDDTPPTVEVISMDSKSHCRDKLRVLGNNLRKQNTISSGTSNWTVSPVSDKGANVDHIQSTENHLAFRSNTNMRKRITLNGIFKEVNRMPITDKLKNKLKAAIFKNRKDLNKPILARRKLVKIPILRKTGEITTDYITNLLSYALGGNTKVTSSLVVEKSADMMCDDLTELAPLLPGEKTTEEPFNSENTFKLDNDDDEENCVEVEEREVTDRVDACDHGAINEDPSKEELKELIELLSEPIDESTDHEPFNFNFILDEIPCNGPLPCHISRIIKNILPSEHVRVYKEPVPSTGFSDASKSAPFDDSSFSKIPSEIVIRPGFSVKLSEIPSDHKDIPKPVRDMIQYSNNKVAKVILMKESRLRKKNTIVPHIVLPSDSHETKTVDSGSPKDVSKDEPEINDYQSREICGEISEPDVFHNRNTCAAPEEELLKLDQHESQDTSEPEEISFRDSQEVLNSTLSDDLSQHSDGLEPLENETSDGAIAIPQDSQRVKVVEVSLTDDNLPDHLKKVIEDVSPGPAKVMLLHDLNKVKLSMNEGECRIPEHIREVVKSLNPQSNNVILLKRKNSDEVSNVKYAHLDKSVSSSNDTVNTKSQLIDNKLNTVLTTNDESDLTKGNQSCFCGGLSTSLDIGWFLTKKRIQTVPAPYRPLANTFLALKIENRKLKKTCNRYKLLKDKFKNRPHVIKFEELVSELKKSLKPEAFDFLFSTLLYSHREVDSKGQRYSEELKRICSKIVLSGGWKPYFYLSTFLSLPRKGTIRQFIYDQINLIKSAQFKEKETDLITLATTSSTIQSTRADDIIPSSSLDLHNAKFSGNTVPLTSLTCDDMNLNSINATSSSVPDGSPSIIQTDAAFTPSPSSVLQMMNSDGITSLSSSDIQNGNNEGLTNPFTLPVSVSGQSGTALFHAYDILSFGRLENILASKEELKKHEGVPFLKKKLKKQYEANVEGNKFANNLGKKKRSSCVKPLLPSNKNEENLSPNKFHSYSKTSSSSVKSFLKRVNVFENRNISCTNESTCGSNFEQVFGEIMNSLSMDIDKDEEESTSPRIMTINCNALDEPTSSTNSFKAFTNRDTECNGEMFLHNHYKNEEDDTNQCIEIEIIPEELDEEQLNQFPEQDGSQVIFIEERTNNSLDNAVDFCNSSQSSSNFVNSSTLDSGNAADDNKWSSMEMDVVGSYVEI